MLYRSDLKLSWKTLELIRTKKKVKESRLGLEAKRGIRPVIHSGLSECRILIWEEPTDLYFSKKLEISHLKLTGPCQNRVPSFTSPGQVVLSPVAEKLHSAAFFLQYWQMVKWKGRSKRGNQCDFTQSSLLGQPCLLCAYSSWFPCSQSGF